MINPFKNEYDAKLLNIEGDEAVVEIIGGALQEKLRIPVSLLPKELDREKPLFSLRFQSKETAQKGTYESMRMLLEDLIQ